MIELQLNLRRWIRMHVVRIVNIIQQKRYTYPGSRGSGILSFCGGWNRKISTFSRHYHRWCARPVLVVCRGGRWCQFVRVIAVAEPVGGSKMSLWGSSRTCHSIPPFPTGLNEETRLSRVKCANKMVFFPEIFQVSTKLYSEAIVVCR